jgi:hypothetical protein
MAHNGNISVHPKFMAFFRVQTGPIFKPGPVISKRRLVFVIEKPILWHKPVFCPFFKIVS